MVDTNHISEALELKAAGASTAEIASRFGVSRHTAWRWIAPGKNERLARDREHYARKNADPEWRLQKRKVIKRSRDKTSKTLIGRASQCLSFCRQRARIFGYAACTATPQEVSDAMVQQGFCCKICCAADSDSRLAMDHDHKTGIFRGWLCDNCNNGLGRFKDSPTLLRVAIDYLSND